MLPTISSEEEIDELLIGVHDTYQKSDFGEEEVEVMCEKAKSLIQAVAPKELVHNQKPLISSM